MNPPLLLCAISVKLTIRNLIKMAVKNLFCFNITEWQSKKHKPPINFSNQEKLLLLNISNYFFSKT
jgi:hypothetical protein